MAQDMHYTVVIVGGGSGGISVASRLVRAAKSLRDHVVVIDPSDKHYYQPLWTLVGGGAAQKQATERDEASVIPDGVKWMQDAVTEFTPDANYLTTKSGTKVHYDYLVVAPGIQIDWDKIKGLKEAIGKDGVCSNYSYDYVDSTWESIRNFKGGRAIFSYPNTAIKCGGAPQKIMYLAEEHFAKAGVRDATEVVFASAGGSIFSVKKYADALDKVIERKGIKTAYKRNLVEIRADKKEAVFENMDTKQQEVMKYDMIHVVPPMSSPDFIKKSPLADANGWVDVDKFTLQHKKYPNVFGLGDASNLPTSKTGAAIRKQAPTVEKNLLSLMHDQALLKKYNGYTSCPLVTGYGSLILAEFDYDLNPMETFPFDQGVERFSMYLLKKELLPVVYWDGMLKGLL
ncbi:NAD(P)/FAD-dependent oxidoreductase [Sulfoacidibacillus ferrooxidans]|uniref:Sulfide dehydrogenase [flavocytochrome c] flavoprotein chain n=1 Tax=Sulfoacidibacillus ferrooxidans TaxID=2005001 RepID=A0A9X1V6G3_9BACL|nr:FAD/NAD(P)-binding oxidoreductase [Sulfoacidibacillus ferrooxidans]MCI0182085.1 Sulfide dehydrogenase [flavocytochrome c] flavoprotein chain [Sulfoacidibacillus ferrooxidans]